MSIRIAKEICCDNCHDSVRLDARTLTEEWPSLARDGWTRKGGKHRCPKCSGKTRRARPPVEFENADRGDEG